MQDTKLLIQISEIDAEVEKLKRKKNTISILYFSLCIFFWSFSLNEINYLNFNINIIDILLLIFAYLSAGFFSYLIYVQIISKISYELYKKEKKLDDLKSKYKILENEYYQNSIK